jgi:hypothetical protein
MEVSGQRHAPDTLLAPRKGPPVPIVQEAGWAPEPVWTQRLEEKFFAPAGDRTPIAQPVVRHCTACANPAPAHRVYVWVLYDSQNRQRLFPKIHYPFDV